MAKKYYSMAIIVSVILLTGCIAKDVDFTEQQQRMQRCDQYIEQDRDRCLRGEPVTIEDYKDDFRDYQKSKEIEAEKAKPKVILPIVIELGEDDKKNP
jgi:hypothetical protein